MYPSPVEMQLDSLASELFGRILDEKVRRVVSASCYWRVGRLQRCSMDTQRFADFMYAIRQWFAAEMLDAWMTYELQELREIHSISNPLISQYCR
jgi:hypothetical protein